MLHHTIRRYFHHSGLGLDSFIRPTCHLLNELLILDDPNDN